MNPILVLDCEKCIRCSCCIDTCPMDDVTTDDEDYPAFQRISCICCYMNETTCPQQTITIQNECFDKKYDLKSCFLLLS